MKGVAYRRRHGLDHRLTNDVIAKPKTSACVHQYVGSYEFLDGSEERRRRHIEHRSHVIERDGPAEHRCGRGDLACECREAGEPLARHVADALRHAHIWELGTIDADA